MAADDLAVVNLALNRLGHKTITALDDGTEVSSLMSSIYSGTVNEMLSVMPWNCAVKRAELPLSAEPNLTQYQYSFELPGDVVRVLDIDGEKNKIYRIEGQYLYTDEINEAGDGVIIRYIYKLTDPIDWDEFLEEAVVLRLAEKACLKITKNISLTSYLQQQVIMSLQIAQQSANMEDREDISGIIASINNAKLADILLSKNNYAAG